MKSAPGDALLSLAGDVSTAGLASLGTPLDRAMDRYAQGDDVAFTEVARALAPKLRTFLRRRTGATESADDLIQDTFLCMHRSRGSFVLGSPVLPWAYAITRNCLLNQVRAKKSRFFQNGLDVTDLNVATGPELGADAAVAARQAIEIVVRALATMPLPNREAFVLLRYEGLSVASAAKVVGISDGALKLRAFRAYRLLRDALATADARSHERVDRNSFDDVDWDRRDHADMI